MQEIVMNCMVHGGRTLDEVVKFKSSRTSRGFKYKCKICKQAENLKYKAKNRKILCEKNKEYKKNNRDVVNDWQRQDRLKNPEKYLSYEKERRLKNWKKNSVNESLRTLGCTKEKYELLILTQENKCAICNKEETKKSRTPGKICRLAIDHNHDTLKIRGLLCHECNTGLGKFKDSKDLLLKAIEYLKKHE